MKKFLEKSRAQAEQKERRKLELKDYEFKDCQDLSNLDLQK